MLRLNHVSLRARMLVSVLIPVALLGAVITTYVTTTISHQGEERIAGLRKQMLSDRKDELRDLIQAAKSAIDPIYDKAGANDAAAKQQAKAILRSFAYGKNGYVFVYRDDGTNLVQRPNEKLQGRNLWNLKAPNGHYLIRDMVHVARNGGGFYRYPWKEPSTGKTAPKLSYVAALGKWHWMLGTGVYINDINHAVAAAKARIHGEIQSTIVWAVGLTAGGMALILIIITLLSSSLTRPIHGVRTALADIAQGEGDLTRRLEENGPPEINALAREFNGFVEKIQRTIAQVKDAAGHLSGAAAQLANVASQTSTGVERQSEDTDQIATAINEMTATVQEISRSATEVEGAASSTDQAATSGRSLVSETVQSIERLAGDIHETSEAVGQLAQRSEEIETVLDVIKQVTEQTNLLALNAAIEAARAGDHGRGFAVVADEVRGLALRTASSAEEIRGMIDALGNDTRRAVTRMKSSESLSAETVTRATQTGEAIDEIHRAASQIHSQITQIATGAEEQSKVAEEINRNISSIVKISQESLKGTEDTAGASEEVARLSDHISSLTDQFRT